MNETVRLFLGHPHLFIVLIPRWWRYDIVGILHVSTTDHSLLAPKSNVSQTELYVCGPYHTNDPPAVVPGTYSAVYHVFVVWHTWLSLSDNKNDKIVWQWLRSARTCLLCINTIIT